jgi:DNA (cytosine-5)-methyltransferase 1
MIKFIDLFAGLGGFRIALESLGFECVFASEIDGDCCDTYSDNFGDHPVGDITKIEVDQIPDHDILCGGFPCQTFSIAGKKAGFQDTRGTLFYDVARIVLEKKPKILLLENVKNLVSHDGGRTIQVMKQTLQAAGYDVFVEVLNASYFGIPTQRQRTYIVGFANQLGVDTFNFPPRTNVAVSLSQMLDLGVPDTYRVDREDITFTDAEQTQQTQQNKPIRVGSVGPGRQGERIYSPEGHAITFSSSGGGPGATSGLYLVQNKVRRLTPRECFRVMGFPETYRINLNDRVAYRQIGNSVAIPVVRAVARQIIQTLFERALR